MIPALRATETMSQRKATVTLPEGVSLERVGQILLDAWEGGMRQRKSGPFELRESDAAAGPIPRDAPELFRLLSERQVPYLLVGGIAMLAYVEGRNTRDVDLLLSVEALQQIPELEILEKNDFFAHAKEQKKPLQLPRNHLHIIFNVPIIIMQSLIRIERLC